MATVHAGVIARYVDTNNWLRATLTSTGTNVAPSGVAVNKRVAGTITQLASTTFSGVLASSTSDTGGIYRLQLAADTQGRWFVWIDGTLVLQGQDDVLATGGTLATGDAYLYDENPNAGAFIKKYDNFAAWTFTADAAVFDGQSIELRHNTVVREDAAGAIWQRVSDYRGDYLLVPPAGQEGRTIRAIATPVRHDPLTGPDSGIDDISGRLFVTPRYLTIPD